MQKYKVWKETIFLSLAGVFTGILIGEIGLRVAKIEGVQKMPDYVDSAPTDFHTADPDLGWWHKPGASGWWTQEGKAFIQMNSAGLRDREHSKEKPKDTFRIAVLGDSFTEALQVPVEKTFWAEIEPKLAQCKALQGKKVEAINFGVHGYGTAQELIVLQKKVWDYAPDLVLLGFFNGNDVINNSRQLEYDPYRPFFVYKDGALVGDMSFRNLAPVDRNQYAVSWVDRLPGWLVNHSRILQLLKKSELNLKKEKLSKEFTRLSILNFKEPSDKTWQDAWQVTEGLLELMNQEVKQKAVPFFVFTIGDPMSVLPDPKARQTFTQTNKIQDLFYPDKRVKAVGDRAGFPVLNLSPTFQQYAEQKRVCLHGFDNAMLCQGHWNIEGHRLAGEILSSNVCQFLSNTSVSAPSTPEKQKKNNK